MPEPVQKPSGNKETVVRTLLVALVVSLVCSSLVASAAVVLKPRQVANAILDMRRNILEVAGLLDPDVDVDAAFARIEPRVVDLETGAYVDDLDPETFDPADAAKDPERSVEVPADIDVARVGRRAKRALVYLVRENGEVSKISHGSQHILVVIGSPEGEALPTMVNGDSLIQEEQYPLCCAPHQLPH